MASQTKLPKDYVNNPFFIAINGLTKLFNLALGVGLVLVALSFTLSFSSNPEYPTTEDGRPDVEQISQTVTGWSTNDWVTTIGAVVIIGAAIILLSALFSGVSAYTSAQLAKDKKVSLNEAFKVAFDHLWGFLWLQIIIGVKLFLWTLLFIIPGIIMSVRYSLAKVAFFDKDLRGNAAIKESLRLTKNAWFTTFAGNALFNYITLGMISWVVTTGTNAVLYRQFKQVGDNKPPAHWLSWVTFFLPFILLALLIGLVILIVAVISASGGTFSQ